MRRALTAVVAILALSCALAPGASAHTKKFSTTATGTKQIIPSQSGPVMANYSGTVSSSNPKCVPDRTVFLGNNDGTLGTGVTDAAGNWAINNVSSTATGGGPAQKTIKKNRNHKHVCKFGTFFFLALG